MNMTSTYLIYPRISLALSCNYSLVLWYCCGHTWIFMDLPSSGLHHGGLWMVSVLGTDQGEFVIRSCGLFLPYLGLLFGSLSVFGFFG